MTHTTQFRWTSAAHSHVGLVRRINEDSVLELAERGRWAVADGMGGHARGDVASRMVVERLAALPDAPGLAEEVASAAAGLQEVNRSLCEEAADSGVSVIGSTVVALFARGYQCTFLWAGDSRLYLCRGASLQRLTRDHSQVEELVTSGNLQAEEAQRLPGHNLITRAVGATDSLELDSESMLAEDGDMFLLCSDGLWNEVGADELLGALVPGDCRLAAERLVDLALAHGARDNVSVVVVRASDMHSDEQTVLNPSL